MGFSIVTLAASTLLPRTLGGFSKRNWSRESRPGMYTARAGSLPRPARPHCCQMEATLPGYPQQTTASRAPTSTPSSRAFVETTPRRSAFDLFFLGV